MKKLLQFVALVLALCVSAQPVLAEGACTQPVCRSQQMTACCPSADHMQAAVGAMPMGQGETVQMAVGPMQCSCYVAPAEMGPAIPEASASGVVSDGASVAPAAWLTPKIWTATKRLPSVRVSSPTARYILFRDFRI